MILPTMNNQPGTITNHTDVLTSGPFGTVSTLQGYYSSNLTAIGSATMV